KAARQLARGLRVAPVKNVGCGGISEADDHRLPVYLNTVYPCIIFEKELVMTSETARIADQLHRAFDGSAWHGDSLFELLQGVSAQQAAARPIKNAHSIWELVLHIAAWDSAVRRRMNGETVQLQGDDNFPPVKDASGAAWRNALAHAKHSHEELVKSVAAFP